MNALTLLISDHDTVRELFRKFESAQERGDKQRQAELVRRIAGELKVHTAIEEEVLYPEAKQTGGEREDLVLEGVEEHHVVDQLLAELETMTPDDEAFTAKVTVLIESVEHHAEEEEEELFPALRQVLSDEQLEDLGKRLQQAKQRHQREDSDSAQDPSREELYRQAQELDVPGRSSMNKDDLAKAVRQRQG